MYEDLKQKLQSILEKEDVVSNSEVISAYDLSVATNQVLGDLFDILDTGDAEDAINKKYDLGNVIASRIAIFRKKNIATRLFPTVNYIQHYSNKNENYSTVSFSLGQKESDLINFSVSKYQNDDSLFFEYSNNNPKATEFIKDNMDYIMHSYQVMEAFKENFDYNIDAYNIDSPDAKQVYTDKFIKVTFNATYKSAINIELFDPRENKIYFREWICKEPLEEFVYRNKESFLKKIPIPVDELNPLFKKIVYLSYEKRQQPTLKK